MNIALFFALAGVYLLGIAGVVLSGEILIAPPSAPGRLEDRLAMVREPSRPMPGERNRAS